MRPITWEEAEAAFPSCSAAFDRDIGDLMRDVTIYALECFPIPQPYYVKEEDTWIKPPSFRIWAKAEFANPEDLTTKTNHPDWITHVASVAYLSGYSATRAPRYAVRCACGQHANYDTEAEAMRATEQHQKAVIRHRRQSGLWSGFDASQPFSATGRPGYWRLRFDHHSEQNLPWNLS